MDERDLFLVDDEQLHPFTASEPLSDEVLTALQNDLGTAVGETVLPIAHWEHDRTGPLSIALNYEGELVALVLADMFPDQNSIISTLSTLEQWLAPMSLDDLGDLSGDLAKFNTGLSELSPHLPMELASMLRILLVNPQFIPNSETLRAALPFSRIEVLEVRAFEGHDGTMAVSKRHTRSEQVIEGLEASSDSPIVVHLDSPAPSAPQHAADVIELDEPIDPVELTEQPENTENTQTTRDTEQVAEVDLTIEPPTGSWPTIIRGSIYPSAQLPLYFDPTGAKVESLSTELFAVDAHLALIVNLDNYAINPLETSALFRWGASIEKNELFARHSRDAWGRTRMVHLFVESNAYEGQVFYLGRGEHVHRDEPTDRFSLWFTMSPALDAQRLETIRSGQLPQDQPRFSFSFAAHAAKEEAEAERQDSPSFSFSGPASSTASQATEFLGTWVPND